MKEEGEVGVTVPVSSEKPRDRGRSPNKGHLPRAPHPRTQLCSPAEEASLSLCLSHQAALVTIRGPLALSVLPPRWGLASLEDLGKGHFPAPSLCSALWPQTPSWALGPHPPRQAWGHHARPQPTCPPASPLSRACPAPWGHSHPAGGSGLPQCSRWPCISHRPLPRPL